jgi:hypothetical protein
MVVGVPRTQRNKTTVGTVGRRRRPMVAMRKQTLSLPGDHRSCWLMVPAFGALHSCP